jgi:ureidoacrylate peracid hydrolase
MTPPSIRPDVAERALQRRGQLHMVTSLPAAQTALIVVDMQNYFLEPGAAVEVPGARDIVPAVNRLAEAARAAGSPVVWIQMTHDESHMKSWSVFYERLNSPQRSQGNLDAMRAGSHMHALWPEMKTDPSDLWVHKSRFSAFLPESSDLAKILRARGVENVIITGTLTNVCCMTSALDAMMMNFRTIMVSDANAARIEDHHFATLNNVFETFGDVRTTDEVIGLLQSGSTQARAAE